MSSRNLTQQCHAFEAVLLAGDTIVTYKTLEAIKNGRAKVIVPDYCEITSCLGRTDIHCRGSEPEGAGWRIKIRNI